MNKRDTNVQQKELNSELLREEGNSFVIIE